MNNREERFILKAALRELQNGRSALYIFVEYEQLFDNLHPAEALRIESLISSMSYLMKQGFDITDTEEEEEE